MGREKRGEGGLREGRIGGRRKGQSKASNVKKKERGRTEGGGGKREARERPLRPDSCKDLWE